METLFRIQCFAMIHHQKNYHLKLNIIANRVKSCFETSDKDELYLGKNVLKDQITEAEFQKEMIKYR